MRNFARRDGEGQERVEAEDKEVDEDNDEGDEEKSVTISPLPPPLLLSSFFAAAACLMCVSAFSRCRCGANGAIDGVAGGTVFAEEVTKERLGDGGVSQPAPLRNVMPHRRSDHLYALHG